MKVTILIPANKPIRPKTVKSLADMIAVSPYEFLTILAEEGYTPSEKRNYGIVQSLNNNCDFTLFIDDDMVFPPETLKTLISRDKDIIGGLYYIKHEPLMPVVELEEGQFISLVEPFRCKGTGAGLMLVKNPVLRKIAPPWFDTKVNEFGQTIIGDSYWFCDKVREREFEIWNDPTLKIGHLGEYTYG